MKNDLLKKVGGRLKYVRNLLDMTQAEVAEKTGLEKSCISRMEGGQGGTALSILLVLEFYSALVRTDVILDDRMWEAAVTEEDLIFKDKGVSSVLEAKIAAAEKGVLKQLQKTRNEMNRSLNTLQNRIKRSTLSVKSLLGD